MAMKDMLPSLPPDKASLAKWCFIAIYAVKSISVAPLATSGTGFIHSDSGTAEFIADQTVIQQRTR
jgi:hypothetical protein